MKGTDGVAKVIERKQGWAYYKAKLYCWVFKGLQTFDSPHTVSPRVQRVFTISIGTALVKNVKFYHFFFLSCLVSYVSYDSYASHASYFSHASHVSHVSHISHVSHASHVIYVNYVFS